MFGLPVSVLAAAHGVGATHGSRPSPHAILPVMQEAIWAGLLLLGLAAFSTVALLPCEQVLRFGNGLMLGSAALGIPTELVYFLLLGLALGRSGARPAGWYWRSFDHHHLLSQRARRLVLPWFYVGAAAFLGIGLGILIVVLALVSALMGR